VPGPVRVYLNVWRAEDDELRGSLNVETVEVWLLIKCERLNQ
jgi:hypothetical protein